MDSLCLIKEIVKWQIEKRVYLLTRPIMSGWVIILKKFTCVWFCAHVISACFLSPRMIPFLDPAVNLLRALELTNE